MPKNQIRERLKEMRSRVSDEEILSAGTRVCTYLQFFLSQKNWLLYASIQSELSTKPIFEFLKAHNKNIFFPRIFDSEIRFFEVKYWSELKQTGRIPEPDGTSSEFKSDDGVALVPGLGFQYSGHRIGFGGGFYDRFLGQHSQLLRIGLAYECQLLLTGSWPAESHDQTMDHILTPSGLWGSKRIHQSSLQT